MMWWNANISIRSPHILWKNIKKIEYILKYFRQNLPYIMSTLKIWNLTFDWFFPHYQYYDCWWPGDARSQGINRHDIDHAKTVLWQKIQYGVYPILPDPICMPASVTKLDCLIHLSNGRVNCRTNSPDLPWRRTLNLDFFRILNIIFSDNWKKNNNNSWIFKSLNIIHVDTVGVEASHIVIHCSDVIGVLRYAKSMDCLINSLFSLITQKTSQIHITGLCEEIPPKIHFLWADNINQMLDEISPNPTALQAC